MQTPENIAALLNEAVALHNAGRQDEAARLYQKVLTQDPRHFDATHLLGLAHLQSGDLLNAAALIETALGLRPEAAAYGNLGLAYAGLKRFDEALVAYDRALALTPHSADVLNNRALTLWALKRHEDALASLQGALASRPDFPEAFNNQGNLLRDLQRPGEAIASFDRALALRPHYAIALSNRANALRDLGQTAEAILTYNRALALQPTAADTLHNRGVALRDLDRLDEAMANFDAAIAQNPTYVDAFVSRGIALADLGKPAAALRDFHHAQSLDPQHANAHWNEAIVHLRAGDLAAGWPKYEWRWHQAGQRIIPRIFAVPQWTGREDLAGRTILLHAEQGFGDTIQFCGYAALVATRGARVVLEARAPLLPLLRSLAGVDTLVAFGDAMPAFDLHCPLMSLPLAFGTTLESIPAAPAYLAAPDDLLAAWTAKLGPQTKPRIGLVWSGNAAHTNDRRRSLSLAQLLPAVSTAAELFVLQKDIRPADQETLMAHPEIHNFAGDIKDFGETAALTTLMDLVITVDTSAAHLAGALGRPTWVLVSNVPDWRWLMDRTDSPWYPTIRLFRQTTRGEWGPAIAAITQQLPAAI